jgi:hypothetical protein
MGRVFRGFGQDEQDFQDEYGLVFQVGREESGFRNRTKRLGV